MKKFASVLLVGLVSFSLLLSGCSSGGQKPAATEQPKQSAPTTPIELKIASEYNDRHPGSVNAIIPWYKKIEEQSANAVRFTYYPPNALVPMKDGYRSTVSGMVDILAAPAWYNNYDKYPELEVLGYPFIAPSSEAGALVAMDIIKKYPDIEKRIGDTKFLTAWSSATLQLHTTKKLVKTVEDLKGMRLISSDVAVIEIIKAVGANPIEVTPADTYLALQRGTADGIIFPIAPIRSLKITDVSKYHTIMDLSTGMFTLVMNKDKFASLPANVQQLIETTGPSLGQSISKAIDQGSVDDAKWMKENGHTFYVLPASEKEKLAAKIKPVIDNLIQKSEAKGVKNARELYEEAKRLGVEKGKIAGKGYVE